MQVSRSRESATQGEILDELQRLEATVERLEWALEDRAATITLLEERLADFRERLNLAYAELGGQQSETEAARQELILLRSSPIFQIRSLTRSVPRSISKRLGKKRYGRGDSLEQ